MGSAYLAHDDEADVHVWLTEVDHETDAHDGDWQAEE